MRFSILAQSTCLLLFTSLTPQIFASSNSTSGLDENQNYVNQLLGFSFHPPDNWTLQELKKTQPNAPDVAIVSPEVEGFAPVISISVENSNGASLEEHVKDERARLQSAVDAGDMIFLSNQTTKVNGLDTYISETTGHFLSQNKDFIVKFKEGIISANGKFYTVTYANQEKYFDGNMQSFDDVLNSFQILSGKTNELSNNIPFEIGVGIAIAIGAFVILLVKRKNSKKTSQNPAGLT